MDAMEHRAGHRGGSYMDAMGDRAWDREGTDMDPMGHRVWDHERTDIDAGVLAWDSCLLDTDTFWRNFHHEKPPKKTYLCCEMKLPKGASGVPQGQDKGVLHNLPAQHAEVRLLKRIQSWELGSELPYEVTCFQSWSPCCNCAKQLARFLEENKHVTLSIFASRLHTMEDYEEGLRILRSAGAHIAIMTSQDFEHCWDTSVDNHGNPFQPWDTLVSQSQKLSEKLKVILKRAEDGLQCR